MRTGRGRGLLRAATRETKVSHQRKGPAQRPGNLIADYHPRLAMSEAYLRPRVLSVQKVTQEHAAA